MNYGVSTRWQRRFPSLLARRRRGSIWAKLTSLSSTTAGTPRFSTGAPCGPNSSIKTRSRRRWPPCSPGCRKGPAAGASLSGANGKQLRKVDHQIRDILHKQTTALVSTLHASGVQTVVIGDVRDLRQRVDYGPAANQRIHQMATGKVRWLITYKAEQLGMRVVLQDEAYTSQECPRCGSRHKPRVRMYVCQSCAFCSTAMGSVRSTSGASIWVSTQ